MNIGVDTIEIEGNLMERKFFLSNTAEQLCTTLINSTKFDSKFLYLEAIEIIFNISYSVTTAMEDRLHVANFYKDLNNNLNSFNKKIKKSFRPNKKIQPMYKGVSALFNTYDSFIEDVTSFAAKERLMFISEISQQLFNQMCDTIAIDELYSFEEVIEVLSWMVYYIGDNINDKSELNTFFKLINNNIKEKNKTVQQLVGTSIF